MHTTEYLFQKTIKDMEMKRFLKLAYLRGLDPYSPSYLW